MKNKYDNRQLSLFHYLCIQIQKSFRGYYSRKYKQSMRKRKRYCQRISEEGEKVRKMMEKYSEEQIQVIIVIRRILYTFNTSFPFAERKTGSSIEERKRIQNTSSKSASFIEYATNIWHLQSIWRVLGGIPELLDYRKP